VICVRRKVSFVSEKDTIQQQSEFIPDKRENPDLKGKGCEACASTGYQGRTGIYEILAIGSGIKSLILKNPEAGLIKTKAIELGMKTLREDGFQKVNYGITTLDEVIRVT